MEVLLVSPVRPIYIVVSKMVPYFVLSCINLATILLLSVFVLGVPVAGSLAALWLARVPAAYLLAHFFGPMNIHFCYAIGWALGLAICVPYYFSGRWKEKSIVARAAGGC